MSGGKETLKGSMHSGIYITHSLIGAFDPERRSNIDDSVKRRDSALFTAGVSSSISVRVRFLGKIDGYAT